MSERKVRNTCLDFLKGIACIFVVFMHCEFPGRLGALVQCISRFCVPFFFMVSGYFAFKKFRHTHAQRSKIFHILKITALASLFYILVAVLTNSVSGVSVKALLGFVLLNQPVVIAGQLWFLFALLYDYILWAIVDRYDLYRFAYPTIPVLMLVYICLAQGAHLAGIHVPNLIYRNFLIEGFPFFMLGHWIHRNQDKIQISNRALLLIFLAATLL